MELPKPLLARAALTGLATIQKRFKIPVQPPPAQTHSPAGKSIHSRLGLDEFYTLHSCFSGYAGKEAPVLLLFAL